MIIQILIGAVIAYLILMFIMHKIFEKFFMFIMFMISAVFIVAVLYFVLRGI